MRRPVKNRNKVKPDFMYQSTLVEKFINYIMESGKKNAARKILYGVFADIKTNLKTDPLELFENVIKSVGPTMEVRSRRVGGANYQVPMEVRPERKIALAMRWIKEAASSKKGSPMKKRLFDELVACSKNEGEAIKKRDNVHKMAEANRAFAHFGFSGNKRPRPVATTAPREAATVTPAPVAAAPAV